MKKDTLLFKKNLYKKNKQIPLKLVISKNYNVSVEKLIV